MITLSTLFVFAGFWICYQTSRRAVVHTTGWIRSNRAKGNLIGVAGLLCGLVLSMITLGVGSGLFSFLMTVTVAGSMIILLCPLGYVNFRSVGVIALISFFLELTI